ncbi:tetratricopeptide repeat-containing sulfotransferase family protein [Altericroceibacterium endophyticum]|uniref:Tetratricopeptide repeat protein n=1 Tax=Altericroceibacterium endophyticum TaxID=1808508 RepID=A0A6I4T2P9_9SPHN|nr:tetratricopeptide repeat-containing sulfotransferase family protein [Altericroceibacterium endophyticum]MXO65514.1 tetratricopeptide repeat protein [Altericroceibacterium endophyticum]
MQQAQSDQRLEEMMQKIQTGSLRMTEQEAVVIAGQLYGRGKYKEAETVCRQLIAHKPKMTDAHSILGVSLHAQGKGKEGVQALRQAVKFAPKIASYHSNLGEVLRQQGNLADASVTLKEAVALDPKNAQAHNNLGITRFEADAVEDAIVSYRKAIELRPDFPEAYNNLGNALRRNGDREGAIEAYQNALAQREVYPEAYNNLGTMLRELGKLDQAEHALRKAIQQRPTYVDALNNLAAFYAGKGEDVEALRQLAEVLKIAPKDKRALTLTARIQQRRGNDVAAEQASKFVLRDDPENVDALIVLGTLAQEHDKYDEALKYLEKAVEYGPKNAEAINYYGVTLKSVGRLEEAREQLLYGLEINPNMYGAYANLNDLVDFSKEKDLFKQMDDIMKDPAAVSESQQIPLHFAYAKALDDNKRHKEALEHYIEGGKLKRATLKYDQKETFKFFSDIKKAFPAKIFKDRPFEGSNTDRLLFIVGMPRSGSTLVEQIISSHDQVYGAGEVKYLSQGIHKLRDRFPSLSVFPEMVKELREPQWKLLAGGYEEAMFRNAGDAKLVTDKLLTNYFFIGMIHLLFPNAKIINTRRNPIDTCLSGFTKLFKDDMPHSYDLGELGRYYRQYDALMKHWEKVLPKGVMKVVNYEDIVENTEAEAKSVIDFIGLDWDKKLLDFHKSSRPVKTASVAQVRQPIYKTSMKRSEKYGAGLKPLIDAIEKS